MTLVEFLEARIAEDEAVAIAAGSGAWSWEQGYGDMCNDPDCPYGSLMQEKTTDPNGSNGLTQLMEVHGYDIHQPWEGAAHIARFDPARVLAECASKRALIAITESWGHLTVEDCWFSCAVSTGEDACCDDARAASGECDCGRDYRVNQILVPLAAPYASHPDFQPEWSIG